MQKGDHFGYLLAEADYAEHPRRWRIRDAGDRKRKFASKMML